MVPQSVSLLEDLWQRACWLAQEGLRFALARWGLDPCLCYYL